MVITKKEEEKKAILDLGRRSECKDRHCSMSSLSQCYRTQERYPSHSLLHPLCLLFINPYCSCIVTRGGVCNEILPDPEGNPEGFPEGSGNFSLYTPTQVTIQSFSITSTSQYFLVLTPCLEGNICSRS